MISDRTTRECVEHIMRWQRKHKLQEGQIEELLRWMQKAEGNKSFRLSMIALHNTYKEVCDEREDADNHEREFGAD